MLAQESPGFVVRFCDGPLRPSEMKTRASDDSGKCPPRGDDQESETRTRSDEATSLASLGQFPHEDDALVY